jgi:hypothetical protein
MSALLCSNKVRRSLAGVLLGPFGSCAWPPNGDPMSCNECQLGPTVSYWFQ